MKRAMGGGAHRGPVPPARTRRTLRFLQAVLVLIAAALLGFAGYSLGRVSGFEAGRRAGEIGAPRSPSVVETIVLAVLGTGALAGALLLQGDGFVRMPTPARLDELAGRAEATAVAKAEEVAADRGGT